MFNILEHGAPAVRGARFLDLFCGAGAIGLEADSRGAREVVLVDNDNEALRLARANLERIGAPPSVRLLARDATELGPTAHPFDLVFLDPHYRSGLAGAALEGLRRDGWLGAEALVTLELAATEDLRLPHGYAFERERRYGSAKFLFLRPSA